MLPTSARELRVATLMAAPVITATAILSVPGAGILTVTAPVLGALWLATAAALIVRTARAPLGRANDLRPAWHHLDILTATGATVMWTGSIALIASAITGWASLAVLGVLGLGMVFVAALWTALAAGGDSPWRRAAISRAIVPEVSVEGDALREQLSISGVRIPAGMRLFATGRAMRHGAVTRYAVGSEGSRAELQLDSDLGPAMRGDHAAPAMAFWLGDVLGLTRTPDAEYGEIRFSVLPRPAAVDGARALLGAGGDDAHSEPTQRQPTDGTFRIREYTPGDDTRRIHWVRSLQANRLVVRLPDEIPQAEPQVRLILDSELWGADTLTCRALCELLDALVRVWLGLARALTETGTRVTLVAAVAPHTAPQALDWPLTQRSPQGVLRLGGRVDWQTQVPLGELVTDTAAHVRQVVVSSRPRKLAASLPIAWVVVPELAWTSPEPALPDTSPTKLPFPAGSAENRFGRRRREQKRHQTALDDRTIFSQIVFRTDWATFTGELTALPRNGRVALEVIP